MKTETLTARIGNHTYYRMSVWDAVASLQASIDASGLQVHAHYLPWQSGSLPEGAVPVGQVRVRSGDPEYVLYVL